MLSISASPAAGPSRMATATARFSSTTGEGSACAKRSYNATIWFQSVPAAFDALACTAAIAARRCARGTARVMEEHQREQSQCFRLRQQLDQQPAEADRFV